MNVGAHNAGFITYIAILTMSFLLLLAFMGLRIGQICESNVVDELHLEEAHYAAQKGVHWFVGYCKLGNVWDFQNKLVVIDDEIVSRVHMYVTVDKEKHMHVIKVKPY